jgi:hypothetical protein
LSFMFSNQDPSVKTLCYLQQMRGEIRPPLSLGQQLHRSQQSWILHGFLNFSVPHNSWSLLFHYLWPPLCFKWQPELRKQQRHILKNNSGWIRNKKANIRVCLMLFDSL